MGAGLRRHGFCFHYEGLECLRAWTFLLCSGPSAGDQGNSLMLWVLSMWWDSLWQGWESVQEQRTPVPGWLCWTAFSQFSCWFHVVLCSSGSGELLVLCCYGNLCLVLLAPRGRGCCCDSPHINYPAQVHWQEEDLRSFNAVSLNRGNGCSSTVWKEERSVWGNYGEWKRAASALSI